MILVLLFITFVLSGLMTFLAIPYIVQKAEDKIYMDKPNDRKIHTTPIPRFGGTCFMPIVLVTVCFLVFLVIPSTVTWEGDVQFGISPLWRLTILVISTLVLYVTGIFDDLYGLGYIVKLLMQIISASIISFGLLIPIHAGLTYHPFVAIFFIVYIVNAYNMIDGIDGLASGIAIISLFLIMVAEVLLNNWLGATVAASLTGVLCVFFYYNVFSWLNKIFMGDTGSMTVGLILAFLLISVGLFENNVRRTGFFFTPICLAPLFIPIIDMFRVVINRIINKKNPCLADKTHIHHRLLEAGFTQHQTLRYILYACVLLPLATWFIVSMLYAI